MRPLPDVSWRDEPRFPNQFFTGFIQARVLANTTAMFEQQGTHIACIIKETPARGAVTVEPSRQTQDEWVRIIREASLTDRIFWRECTLAQAQRVP